MSDQIQITRSIRNILIVGLGIVLMSLLRELSTLLLPLVLAGMLSLLCLPLVIKLKSWGIPKFLILPTVALAVCFVIVLILNIFINTFSSIVNDMDQLTFQFNNKVELISQWVSVTFRLNSSGESLASWFWEWVGALQWTEALKGFALGLGDFGKDFFLFFLYFLFLLSGLSEYNRFIKYVVGSKESLLDHIETLQVSISSYIAIKTILSLITGVLCYLICLTFGLNYALFWGFLAFLFNFIPSIGSIISTILPLLMAFIQFDHVGAFIGFASCLLLNQMVIGNVVDPKIMGERMRLNSITVIFGLVFWGYIWGVPGMLLSVPLNVILKMALEQSETLSIAARVMGAPEKLYIKKEEKQKK